VGGGAPEGLAAAAVGAPGVPGDGRVAETDKVNGADARAQGFRQGVDNEIGVHGVGAVGHVMLRLTLRSTVTMVSL
jgi:hypothetical protein